MTTLENLRHVRSLFAIKGNWWGAGQAPGFNRPAQCVGQAAIWHTDTGTALTQAAMELFPDEIVDPMKFSGGTPFVPGVKLRDAKVMERFYGWHIDEFARAWTIPVCVNNYFGYDHVLQMLDRAILNEELKGVSEEVSEDYCAPMTISPPTSYYSADSSGTYSITYSTTDTYSIVV